MVVFWRTTQVELTRTNQQHQNGLMPYKNTSNNASYRDVVKKFSYDRDIALSLHNISRDCKNNKCQGAQMQNTDIKYDIVFLQTYTFWSSSSLPIWWLIFFRTPTLAPIMSSWSSWLLINIYKKEKQQVYNWCKTK